MTVNEMRKRLADAFPSYAFQDHALYSDKQIMGIYRDKLPKLPKYQWVPVEFIWHGQYPTMIMEYKEVK